MCSWIFENYFVVLYRTFEPIFTVYDKCVHASENIGADINDEENIGERLAFSNKHRKNQSSTSGWCPHMRDVIS